MKYEKREFPCVIINVVDGDTVDCRIDLGFGVYVLRRIRLLDIDTPERGEPGYQEAKDHMLQYSGKPLRIITTGKGKFGRWLGKLYDTIDLNQSINEKMITLGLGEPYG